MRPESLWTALPTAARAPWTTLHPKKWIRMLNTYDKL